MGVQETGVQTDRIVTIPNVLSLFRLLAIPVFIWLALGVENDVAAFFVLTASAITDYLDGYLARRWGQISRVGQLLDPLADRLTLVVVIVSLGLRDLVPWWFVVILIARDVSLALSVPLLLRKGRIALPVHFIGKAATFCLLVGFPLLFLSTVQGVIGDAALVVGWAFALWGLVLYWWSAAIYLREIAAVAREQE